MTKLNKTEQKILDHLNSGRAFGACLFGGQGGDGGRVRGGVREYDACSSLVRKGLAEIINRWSHIHYKNGYGIHTYEVSIRKVTK